MMNLASYSDYSNYSPTLRFLLQKKMEEIHNDGYLIGPKALYYIERIEKAISLLDNIREEYYSHTDLIRLTQIFEDNKRYINQIVIYAEPQNVSL